MALLLPEQFLRFSPLFGACTGALSGRVQFLIEQQAHQGPTPLYIRTTRKYPKGADHADKNHAAYQYHG
jgi:hypothetical protein